MDRMAKLAGEERSLLGSIVGALEALWQSWQALDPGLRAAIALGLAVFVFGFLVPRLRPPLQRLGDRLPGGDKRLLGRAAGLLADHSSGRSRIAEPAADLLRVGTGLLTGGQIPASLAGLALDALREHPAASTEAPDAPRALLRAGRAAASGGTPHPSDVSAARRLLGDLAAGGAPPIPQPTVSDTSPRPGFAWLAPKDEGLTLEIRARRRGRVVAEFQVRVPPTPGEPPPEPDGR